MSLSGFMVRAPLLTIETLSALLSLHLVMILSNLTSVLCLLCTEAKFSVPRHKIQRHPKAFYKHLLAALPATDNPEVGHYMERSWYYIFEDDTVGTAPESVLTNSTVVL